MPPLLMKVPLAALEVPLNCVCPPLAPLALATMPPLLMKVPLAAVELTLNCVSPPVAPATAPPLVTKVCVVPELFVTPTPLMVNIKLLLTLIVKASAPGLNTTPPKDTPQTNRASITKPRAGAAAARAVRATP